MKRVLLIILALTIFVPINVLALEADITVIDPYVSAGTYDNGDCVLISSKNKYLLVDTCEGTASFDYLKSKGIEKISILISHYHTDHLKGLLNAETWMSNNNNSNYSLKIEKIFLPNPISLDKYYDQEHITTNKNYYTTITNFASSHGIPIQHLWPNAAGTVNTTNNFYWGDFKVTVLGPIIDNSNNSNCASNMGCEYYQIGKGDTEDAAANASAGHYLNDNSLVTMFQIGNVRYLSAGDTESFKELEDSKSVYIKDPENYTVMNYQEEKLVSNKCASIKADILKLNHHGRRTSNSKSFLDCVNPDYVFFTRSNSENSAAGNQINQVRQVYNFYNNGFNLYSSLQNGTFTFRIRNDNISIIPDDGVYTYGNTMLKTVSVTSSFIDDTTGNPIATNITDDFVFNYTLSNTSFLYDYCGTESNCITSYYLPNHVHRFPGYYLDSDDISVKSTLEGTSVTKKWYYKPINFNVDGILSNDYMGLLYNIDPTLTANGLKNSVTIDSGWGLNVIDQNGSNVGNSEKLKTGYKLVAGKDNYSFSYDVSVKGDATGDGNVNMQDATMLAKHLIDGSSLYGDAYLKAADYDDNNQVKVNDLMRMVYFMENPNSNLPNTNP